MSIFPQLYAELFYIIIKTDLLSLLIFCKIDGRILQISDAGLNQA